MEVLTDLTTFGISFSILALTICISLLTLICLKIKSTKKTPELLGTVGTVKPLEDTEFKKSPRLRPVSTISDVIHDLTDSAANRTPSRAGERKLPDIPRGENNGSELYATLGPNGGSDSEEAETEPTETNHPYAKVKKVKDHPYATVQQERETPRPPPPPEPLVDIRPQPNIEPANQQPQYFSGDSQDSSKGYTSISVREPLRHIRGPIQAQQAPTYAPVSETSDDMYAAIEDPTYLPTGNQSNSDTYAVINLPEDDMDEVELRSAHTYSQVDKSRKRKAISQPVSSNNVDDMYAKVQKNQNLSPPRRWATSGKSSGYETVANPADDNLPVGASAMRTSAEQLLGARPRHHHHRHINYSDYEVSHYDPNNSASKSAKNIEDQGYETVPENRSFLNNDHEGYERVEDFWNNGDDAGYELVRGNSKRRGFERLTFSSSSNKKTDPGYETVPPRPPLPRMNQFHDPPYARLENAKDEEESEEGYETIPASEQRNHPRFDPGYESVQRGSEPGYETVPPKTDPGYETVENKIDPGYETVTAPTVLPSNLQNSAILPSNHQHSTSLPSSANVNVVHMSVRKTQSDPKNEAPPALMPRSTSSSVVTIEHTKMAVNNNIGEEGKEAEEKVQSHIFV